MTGPAPRFEARSVGLPLGAAAFDAAREAQARRRLAPEAAGALLALGAAEAGRAALVAGDALAVTTGQQPGLFTGPLYTVYKALTAAALAEALAARWRRQVVPVFWVAGDDHDFAEVNHCAVLAADGSLATIVLRERASDGPMLPAYREPVGPEGEAALAALRAALPESEFREETLGWLAGSYRADRSVAEAHARALAELLADFGIVVCRGWDAGLKRGAAPVLLAAVRSARELDQALQGEAERLQVAGGEVPVAVGEGLALAMLEGARGRDRLRIADGGFVTRRGGERLTLSALERVLGDEPERVSANVLLRPAVEAHVFPTVAYVGGPAELAYLRQAGPVFSRLGVPRPVAAPRLAGSLIEARVEKALARFGLTAADFERPEGELASRVARAELPPDAVEALAALRGALGERYAAVLAATARLERTLERPVETARNQSLHAVDEIEKRLVAAVKRSSETTLQQLARARTSLFPGGEPQERVLTVASYLARYGRPLLAALRDAAAAHAARLLEAPSARV